MPTMSHFRKKVISQKEKQIDEERQAEQREVSAIHLWFQDSESADRFGSSSAGLWAVTTDTHTNQELSLKHYQLDTVAGGRKIARHQLSVYVLILMCVCVWTEDHIKGNAHSY